MPAVASWPHGKILRKASCLLGCTTYVWCRPAISLGRPTSDASLSGCTLRFCREHFVKQRFARKIEVAHPTCPAQAKQRFGHVPVVKIDKRFTVSANTSNPMAYRATKGDLPYIVSFTQHIGYIETLTTLGALWKTLANACFRWHF